ncbi:MAG: TolC family protein [Bacteroidota bacterium]
MKKSLFYPLLISTLLGLLLGEKTWAQAPDSLLQMALQHNQALQTLQLAYQAALEKAPQVSQLPNPDLGFGAFILPVETRLGPQRARISVSQRFPWFGTLKAQEAWALAEARAVFEQIAGLELELKYRLDQAYLKLYELGATQQMLRQNIGLLQTLKTLTETKVATGAATLADVLRLDLKMGELSQQIKLLENRKRGPQADINQLLHRELTTGVEVDSLLSLAEVPLNRDSLLAVVEARHPLLRRYELQGKAAEAAIYANTLAGRPMFGIGADYFNLGPRTDATPTLNGRDAFQLRATLSIPIYRGKYEARQREEELRIESLSAQKEEAFHRFGAEMEGAYAEYEEAQMELDFYDEQIQTTLAIREILTANYANGEGALAELLALEESLLAYQLKQLQAMVNRHQARAEIMRYVPFY